MTIHTGKDLRINHKALLQKLGSIFQSISKHSFAERPLAYPGAGGRPPEPWQASQVCAISRAVE